jgi:transcription elongation factor GreA
MIMSNSGQSPNLGEAASQFLAGLPPEERKVSQPEVYKFARWYGWERPLAGLTAPEVANYAERLSLSDIDYAKKLELIRAFLVHAKNEGWTKSSLATHLKARKAKGKSPPSTGKSSRQTISLTQEGYAELQAELESLKNRRSEIIDEVRRAAADKDFRENAPLQAAREEHGHIEGQIRELEEVVKSATVIDGKQKVAPKVNIGDSIWLKDLHSAEELHYTVVSPREVDPSKGKISSASPVGKAIMGREQGEVVEVVTPAARMRYQIKLIER